MAKLKQAVAAAAVLLTATLFSVAAEANHRCGFDRYGYHPPDFSGCDRYYRDEGRFYPAYRVYPADGYYARPPGGYYPGGYGCYFDNGYDLRVHRICYRAW